MSEVILIGIDLAKRVFQLHGARSDGSVAYRKKLSRGQLLSFVAQQPKCLIAMEACATAHGWGREFPLCQGCCPLLYFSLIFRWAG
jgi:transposase